MEYIVILAIVAVIMFVLETISILGSAKTYGFSLSFLSWPYLIAGIIKINHVKNLNSYTDAKITLLVITRMWITAEGSVKDDILRMDEEKYGGVVSKLAKKGRIVNKW